MATSYSEIYSRFLPKITNYLFIDLPKEELEDQLYTYLRSSIVKFRYCEKLSKRDDLSQTFNETLTDEEQEILATLMSVEYLTPKLLTDELLQQRLSSKDYTLTSQANHIKEIRSLQDRYSKEAKDLMILYTYKPNKLDGFL